MRTILLSLSLSLFSGSAFAYSRGLSNVSVDDSNTTILYGQADTDPLSGTNLANTVDEEEPIVVPYNDDCDAYIYGDGTIAIVCGPVLLPDES